MIDSVIDVVDLRRNSKILYAVLLGSPRSIFWLISPTAETRNVVHELGSSRQQDPTVIRAPGNADGIEKHSEETPLPSTNYLHPKQEYKEFDAFRNLRKVKKHL